jgi:nucleoside-diphosphate-sugar epimerase
VEIAQRMRVVILGGTRFVGRAIAAALVDRGDVVLLCHRGQTEPRDLPAAEHLHVDRAELSSVQADLAAFRPDAVVDVSGRREQDAEIALAALPDGIKRIVISSGDVYRAFDSLHHDRQTDALPLAEDAPLRPQGEIPGAAMDNIGLERQYLARGGIALRLAMVYGEYDEQRRFEFILRRVRGGRGQIPIGSGSFLFSKVYVGDMANAVLAALDRDVTSESFNICEPFTAPFRLFAQQILNVAGSDAELVTVPQAALPEDMSITGEVSQHLMMDPTKARERLGWVARSALDRSVRWHLDNPPGEWDHDFSIDDAALLTVRE